MIKGSITRAVEFDYLPFNGLSGMKSLKVDSSKFRYLSDDETKRFFGALPNQSKLAKDIIGIAYYTGMRKSEILGLKWENIDYETNQIKLNASDTKTNKFRNIPIHGEVKKIFNSCKGKKGLIFKNSDGGMVTQIEKQWKKFKKEAEIVREIYRLRLENKAYSTIAIILKEKYGDRIKLSYTANRIHKLVGKKFYYGVFTWNEKDVI